MNTGERQGKEPVESKGRKESGMNVHAYVTGRMRGMGSEGSTGCGRKTGPRTQVPRAPLRKLKKPQRTQAVQ